MNPPRLQWRWPQSALLPGCFLCSVPFCDVVTCWICPMGHFRKDRFHSMSWQGLLECGSWPKNQIDFLPFSSQSKWKIVCTMFCFYKAKNNALQTFYFLQLVICLSFFSSLLANAPHSKMASSTAKQSQTAGRKHFCLLRSLRRNPQQKLVEVTKFSQWFMHFTCKTKLFYCCDSADGFFMLVPVGAMESFIGSFILSKLLSLLHTYISTSFSNT